MFILIMNIYYIFLIQCLGHLIDIKVTGHTSALKGSNSVMKLLMLWQLLLVHTLCPPLDLPFISNFIIIFMSQKTNVKL